MESNIRKDIIDTFEYVKEAVRKSEGRSRAGLMLGLQELGTLPDGVIGAYYPVNSNIIVINKTPLQRIEETESRLLKPYLFHVLLHEYIHSLGIVDEGMTRQKTYEISLEHFGENHVVTELARNLERFLPNLVYSAYGWLPKGQTPVELVKGFDRSSTWGYIA